MQIESKENRRIHLPEHKNICAAQIQFRPIFFSLVPHAIGDGKRIDAAGAGKKCKYYAPFLVYVIHKTRFEEAETTRPILQKKKNRIAICLPRRMHKHGLRHRTAQRFICLFTFRTAQIQFIAQIDILGVFFSLSLF